MAEEYEDLDVNLEATVLLALSRLQKATRNCKKNPFRKTCGVSCRKLVEFLKANFPWMDGDIESQVITALLSCIKTGLVCGLDNKKFLLVGTNSKNLISSCMTRVAHGPNCCCLSILKCLNSFPRTCCTIRKTDIPTKKWKKTSKGKMQKGKDAPPPPPSSPPPKRKPTKKVKPKKNSSPKNTCAQRAQKLIGTSKSAISLDGNTNAKCSYCLQIHSLPKLKNLCMKCYPVGNLNNQSIERFSPQDEFWSGPENKE